MNRVISIHLSGNSFQLEEHGYTALRAYLDEAMRQLSSNPDIDEVMLDLEQAIADKCRRFLRTDKNVVLGDEIERIIEEMGPVRDAEMSEDHGALDSDAGDTTARSADAIYPTRQSRKLYRLRNDRMVEGICAGIGAYLGVDPTIVRIVAVVLLILSGGTVAALYLVLIAVIPEARTPEEHAAAHGAPFNAREVLERASTKLQGLHKASEQRQQRRRQPAYWHRRSDAQKGCLSVILTLAAFIVGVIVLMTWLRWPFRSAAIQETLLAPYEPWGQLAILGVLIVGLGILVRKLTRSARGAGTLLVTVLNWCLVILLVTFVVYLTPLAFAGIINLWNWMTGSV